MNYVSQILFEFHRARVTGTHAHSCQISKSHKAHKSLVQGRVKGTLHKEDAKDFSRLSPSAFHEKFLALHARLNPRASVYIYKIYRRHLRESSRRYLRRSRNHIHVKVACIRTRENAAARL